MEETPALSLVGYRLAAEAWEKICNFLEDKEILKIVAARTADGEKPVKVSLDDL